MLNLFADTNISSSWVCSFYKGIATAKYSIKPLSLWSVMHYLNFEYHLSVWLWYHLSYLVNEYQYILAITCLIWNILTHTFVISMTFAKKSHQTSFLSFVVRFFHPCFILLFIWLRASIFFKVYNQIQNDNGWYE